VTACMNASQSKITGDYTRTRVWTLSPLQTVNGLNAKCTEGYANLVNQDYSPGRIVPRGVEIRESGGVGTSAVLKVADGYVSGIEGLSMTNWAITPRTVTVIMHCTPDSGRWYKG
jgi:hypothetical protein